ncbi:hypothetical protein LOK49_LG14G01990 [Camellia lanceoleosa]|uniref:Uncharacterized protein n=1 Tax=Camellia lanceoleosa TaxID=1840588 RepID=A0ACC0FBS7_9ERIC|nr:hypothetical protein LOK49_LG14G01990 [Camellia lanceoleosa]
MVKENRDIRPVLFKFGVALALSLGGILYSILRTKRIKPPQSPPPSDRGDQLDVAEEKTVKINDSIAPEKHEDSCLHKVPLDSSVSGRYSGDKDGFLLPEFNELVKEFDLAATKANFSPKKEVQTPHFDAEMPRSFKLDKGEDYEQEIKNLKNMVKILRERERILEIQLLEYYGLKEQETTVMELQNRLKINNVEAKLFSLKIESLQADNRRLESQVADYAKVIVELEAARAKVKVLKKKLKSESEQNKEQILTLQQRVKKLMNQEHEAVAIDQDIKLKLQRLKDLEEEAEELRKSNHSLGLENSGLVSKLDYTQMLASSVLEDQEAEDLRRERDSLRQQNEDLSKEIEQLQSGRCADVEELVYLRWINACLRYELRNYQPIPGKTVARDLSKTLSPKSEEKAKHLIIEYANKEGGLEKGMNVTDSDFDQWSSSPSNVTDSGDFDDSSVDNSSTNKTYTSSKPQIFSRLKRLIRGKDSHRHSQSSMTLERIVSAEVMMGHPDDSLGSNLGILSDGQANRLSSSSMGCSSRNSDMGSSRVYRSVVLGQESVGDSLQENQFQENPGNVQKLVKYAEVLKESSSGRLKHHRRPVWRGSF